MMTMDTTTTNGLTFLTGCLCAGTGCGGHLMPGWPAAAKVTLTGYQGAARHTYTPGCDGFHASERCP
jgi:hypothetical protein